MKKTSFPIPERLDRFMALYEKHLHEAVRRYPDQYLYGPDKVPEVVAKTRGALNADMFIANGNAYRYTCVELGIKQTEGAIRKWLRTP